MYLILQIYKDSYSLANYVLIKQTFYLVHIAELTQSYTDEDVKSKNPVSIHWLFYKFNVK